MYPKKITIHNTKGKTVYNPSVPFTHKGETYMAVRVESLASELDSQTYFAYAVDVHKDLWEIDYSLPPLPLQDPAYTTIDGELFLLGVRVYQESSRITWKQHIYRGESIDSLEYFVSGPIGMKDIRLVELDECVGVFTRPQGGVFSAGKIGYLDIQSIDELEQFTNKDWYSATIITPLFDDLHWGGVNQALPLSDGSIGVIGHVAYQTTHTKHYAAMSFTFNQQKKTHTSLTRIATRNDFPAALSKRSPELDDVIFPAGIDNDYTLYCGLSDFCIGKKKIKNPF